MSESLEDRLKSHAEAFNGLLSLIPAKHYYGGDTSDQWHKKKQTKEEARIAKRAKLDPDNAKSAKDVMDEYARKRKREAEDGSDMEAVEGVEAEKPLEGFKRATKKTKKQKKDEKDSSHCKATNQTEIGDRPVKDAVTAQKAKAEKRRLKKEKKSAKAEAKAARKALQDEEKDVLGSADPAPAAHESNDEEETGTLDGNMDRIDLDEGTQTSNHDPASTVTPSPRPDSPIFDAPPAQSGSSSISSITQLTTTSTDKDDLEEPEQESTKALRKNARSKEPKPVPEEFRARLEARINELRAARKADDGLNGHPARTRQELIEARRLKEAERKAQKKKLRRQAKEEEDRKHAETLARGSPLLRGSPLYSPATGSNAVNSPAEPNNNFSFGRITFGGNQQVSGRLDDIQNIRAPKGPSDPATALQAAEKRRAHLASLDHSKRADIEEKDMWLNAKKHAHGERVRDDTSLLKKTLKRKEKQKDKSKKEWTERLEGIKKSQGMKQKRREDNLQKRKEEKGGKKGKGKPKPKARPGFEGSFRARPSAAGKKK